MEGRDAHLQRLFRQFWCIELFNQAAWDVSEHFVKVKVVRSKYWLFTNSKGQDWRCFLKVRYINLEFSESKVF